MGESLWLVSSSLCCRKKVQRSESQNCTTWLVAEGVNDEEDDILLTARRIDRTNDLVFGSFLRADEFLGTFGACAGLGSAGFCGTVCVTVRVRAIAPAHCQKK